jgi:glycosyltransferase involved in cell wall biosynthesis
VVKDKPEALSDAVLQLVRHPELRESLGMAAYRKAHGDFQLDRQAEAIERFYQEMIKLGKWKKS